MSVAGRIRQTAVLFLAILVFAGGATITFAAEVGRVELNGRTVILNDDKTWKFADEAAAQGADAACTSIASAIFPVSFCLASDGWERIKAFSADYESSFQSKSGELYLGVIAEKAFIDAAALRKSVLDTANTAGGLKGAKILVDGNQSINGHGWGYISFRVDIDGTIFIFHNYHTSASGTGTVQVIMFNEEPRDAGNVQRREGVLAQLKVGNAQ